MLGSASEALGEAAALAAAEAAGLAEAVVEAGAAAVEAAGFAAGEDGAGAGEDAAGAGAEGFAAAGLAGALEAGAALSLAAPQAAIMTDETSTAGRASRRGRKDRNIGDGTPIGLAFEPDFQVRPQSMEPMSERRQKPVKVCLGLG